jgi:hypothetical protein
MQSRHTTHDRHWQSARLKACPGLQSSPPGGRPSRMVCPNLMAALRGGRHNLPSQLPHTTTPRHHDQIATIILRDISTSRGGIYGWDPRRRSRSRLGERRGQAGDVAGCQRYACSGLDIIPDTQANPQPQQPTSKPGTKCSNHASPAGEVIRY